MYPDESTMTAEQEALYLKARTESTKEIEILAEIEGARTVCRFFHFHSSNKRV